MTLANRTVHAQLTMIEGATAGAKYRLEAGKPNRIGRDLECEVRLITDPLCSRVHAVVFANEDGWWVRDEKSRNGTFLNDQKIDEARIVEGLHLRVGGTVFLFSEKLVERDMPAAPVAMQTVILDRPILPHKPGAIALPTLSETQPEDLLALCDLCVQMLVSNGPDDVIRKALEGLHKATSASWAGFLWITDDGELKPKLVLPETNDDAPLSLSRTLTETVCKKRRAIWVNSQMAIDPIESISHYSDAICIPLIYEQTLLGAVHLYSKRGKFREQAFELAMAAGSVFSTALARSRQSAALVADHQRLVAKGAHFDELVGESPRMRQLKESIARVAKAPSVGCVLIRGESGSGKELVAKALHKASPRADRPMLSVNCAVIPAHLMESALFGHKKGSFTGADEDRQGWFQQADSGTLFLDELGEMTLEGQAKLLRVLEGHPFLPVGGSKEVRVDVRVIAATNRDLAEFVREKKFREDLYYRLSVFELHIPPLRERGADIELLVDRFLEHYGHQYGRPELKLAAETRKRLLEYHWPGNVRQLRNVIDSATVMAEGEEVKPHELGLRDVGESPEQLESLRIDVWEQKLIREALTRVAGNVPEAAKLLGVGRATLYRKIEEYGIER